MQALGVLDIDGLDKAVQLLLGILLVISSPGNADAQSVGNALNARLPDLLVQRRVKADIGGALWHIMSAIQSPRVLEVTMTTKVDGVVDGRVYGIGFSYHCLLRKLLDLLHGAGSPLLEADTVQL